VGLKSYGEDREGEKFPRLKVSRKSLETKTKEEKKIKERNSKRRKLTGGKIHYRKSEGEPK